MAVPKNDDELRKYVTDILINCTQMKKKVESFEEDLINTFETKLKQFTDKNNKDVEEVSKKIEYILNRLTVLEDLNRNNSQLLASNQSSEVESLREDIFNILEKMEQSKLEFKAFCNTFNYTTNSSIYGCNR